MRQVVLDTEAVGYSRGCHPVIIEVGAVELIDGQPRRTFNTLVNPGVSIAPTVRHLTGITDNMLKNAPSFRRVYHSLRLFMNNDPVFAHCASSDIDFINIDLRYYKIKPFEKSRFNCTQKMAKRLGFTKQDIGLKKICNLVGTTNKPSHRALSDAIATAELLNFLQTMEKNGEKWNPETFNQEVSEVS